MPETGSIIERDQLIERLDNQERLIGLLVDEIRKLRQQVGHYETMRISLSVGMEEACRRLGISRTTMTKRLKEGWYPWARQENGHWRFPTDRLEIHCGSGR